MDLDILYEDPDILVVNKPADTPVHPSIHNYENTLANGIAWYFQQKGTPFIFRCINRLDRDTTGLLILGKNAYSASLRYYRSSYPGKKCLQCFPPFFQYEKAGNPPDLSGNYPGNARSSQRHCRCAHCPGKRFCHPALCGL